MGHETEPAPAPAKHRVVVVGGGPAGLEAARRLALQGCRVTLIEQADRLGGKLRATTAAASDHGRILDWLLAQVSALPIEVALGQVATAESIAALAPDQVVLATGTAQDADLAREVADDRLGLGVDEEIVILGGGVAGLPLAHLLGKRGHRVYVLEPSARVGGGLPFVRRLQLLDSLKNLDVRLLTGARDVARAANAVQYTNQLGQRRTVGADRVLATDRAQPDRRLEEALRGLGIRVSAIGDGAGGVNLTEAFQAAAAAARAAGDS
jgi:2,4-dienoyl-CoA reductase (NADPH2)